MELEQIQKQIDEYVSNNGGYFSNENILLNLHEEAAEVGRLVQHLSGVKKFKQPVDHEIEQRMEEEIGGIFFALICLANKNGISLSQAAHKIVSKYRDRDGASGRFNSLKTPN